MKSYDIMFLGLLVFASMAGAKDVTIDPVNYGSITQKNFDDFVLDMGSIVSFTPMAPAKTLGVLGLDVSADLIVSDLANSDSWKYLMEDNDSADVWTAGRLHVQKGLPWQFDVGGMLLVLPDSNVTAWGLELKKGIIEDGALLPLPAISARGSYSRMEGVDNIGLETYSLDLLASKDFLMFTPYLGLSYLHIKGSTDSTLLSGINDVDRSDVRTLGGLQWCPFPLCVVDLELVLGEVTQYGLKAGLRF